jgi:hypothetical protein
MQELVRAINGTLQTRIPRLSIEENEVEMREREINLIGKFILESTDLFNRLFGKIF